VEIPRRRASALLPCSASTTDISLLSSFRRVVLVQILRNLLRVSFRNRRAKRLHHFLYFRIPRRCRQRRLHRDVPRSMATAAINLRFAPPGAFGKPHFKRRVARHAVLRVVSQLSCCRLRHLSEILCRIPTQLALRDGEPAWLARSSPPAMAVPATNPAKNLRSFIAAPFTPPPQPQILAAQSYSKDSQLDSTQVR